MGAFTGAGPFTLMPKRKAPSFLDMVRASKENPFDSVQLPLKQQVEAFREQPPEPEDDSGLNSPPAALNSPPSRLQQLEDQEKQLNAPPRLRNRLMDAIAQAGAVGLSGIFGGTAGAAGAAEGVNQFRDERTAALHSERKNLKQEMEAERQRQERATEFAGEMGMRRLTLKEQLEEHKRQAERAAAEQTHRESTLQEQVRHNRIVEEANRRGAKEIQSYVNKAGRQVVVLEEPAGTITEKEFGEVQPKQDTSRTPYEDFVKGGGSVREYLKLTKPSNTIGGLSPQANTRVQSIAASFDNHPTVKAYNESVNRAQTVESILNQPLGGPGDLAIVYEFMKGLDPTSVVRESEFENAAKSGNIFAGKLTRFNGYLKEEGGFLPENVKAAFGQIMQQKLAASSRQVQGIYKDFGRRIDKITGQPGTGTEYLTDYTGIFGSDPADPNQSFSVKDPTGKVHRFPNQLAADQFKAAAGLK